MKKRFIEDLSRIEKVIFQPSEVLGGTNTALRFSNGEFRDFLNKNTGGIRVGKGKRRLCHTNGLIVATVYVILIHPIGCLIFVHTAFCVTTQYLQHNIQNIHFIIYMCWKEIPNILC